MRTYRWAVGTETGSLSLPHPSTPPLTARVALGIVADGAIGYRRVVDVLQHAMGQQTAACMGDMHGTAFVTGPEHVRSLPT